MLNKIVTRFCILLAVLLVILTPMSGCADNQQNTPPEASPGVSPSSEPSASPSGSTDENQDNGSAELKDILWEEIFPTMKNIDLPERTVEFIKKGLTFTFDNTGALKELSTSNRSLQLDGVYIDTGVDGKTVLNQVGYQPFDQFATWDLPLVTPKIKEMPGLKLERILEDEDRVVVIQSLEDLYWANTYAFENDNMLKVSTRLFTSSTEKKHINGVSFIVRGLDIDYKNTIFEFPGNVPSRVYNMIDYPASYVARTDYSNPLVHFQTGDSHLNVYFIDEQEKWGTGVYRNKEGTVNVANTAAVEAYLVYDSPLEAGNLYIQLPDGDPYDAVVDFYTSKGWTAPEDGVSDGAIYSCHPFGTMDSGFRDALKLQQYADYLETIQKMGYKNVWLLPVFEHPGNNVYESSSLRDIDLRYGGNEGLKIFTDRAHELGLRVMLDYVPHGPAPHMPLAKDNPTWPSKRMDGSLQIEWNCVSFDYNNPGFYQYVVDSVYYHATELGVDGARIDCAMGGLSNWEPVEGLRPSSSGLKAGLNVTRAIREGFLEGGKAPIILPENFHPLPHYAPYTDAFYDMTLFRVIHDLRVREVDETTFATELARWLSVQRATSPKGLTRLRFISNHDVVSWVWDKARPVKTYGQDKAKAIWTLTHFIDGIPMIYQGDEDPSIYRGKGETLIDFFAALNKARDRYLGSEYYIEYLLNDSAVVAFRRFTDSEDRLVIINLSEEELTFKVDGYSKFLYNNGVELKNGIATLSPYGAAMLDKK